jgi:hypothetical protein
VNSKGILSPTLSAKQSENSKMHKKPFFPAVGCCVGEINVT